MKTYKGLDLVKAVAKHEINGGTKLKCVNYPTYGQGVEVDERQRLIWSDTKEPVSYVHFNDNSFEFEIIEEQDIEEIDICTGGIMGFDGVENITGALKDKINELVREVRKLKDKE